MLAIPKSGPIARTTMAYVLAGGRGSRLMELTDRRAKPAVYFGCKSRIIDFALSNALNSGIRRIGVATQYKAHSLIRHLQRGWNFFRVERNESFDILPASQRVSETEWYAGTADAVYQNIDIIESYGPDHIIILAGDHIYKMDYEPMLQQHHERQADVTVGCIEVPREEATGFGVMEVDADRPDHVVSREAGGPAGMPDKPDMALASMGIYVFATKFLFDQLRRDAADPNSSRDFGKDLIPYLVKHGKAVAHRFTESCVRSGFEAEAYWRDVGTLDAYWQANIDLTDVIPALDLYDSDWPIWTYGEITPPAKFVHDEDGRRGQAISSLVSGGCIVSGASLRRSLLFTGVRMHSFASVENAVVMPDVEIGRSAPAAQCHHRSRRADSGRAGRGRGSGGRCAKRFRRTEHGICLITQPMIDRLERDDAAQRSGCRLGDLSADQDRRSRRCRRRAAGRAGRGRRRGAHAGAGLSAGDRRARKAAWRSPRWTICSAARRASSRRRPPASICSSSTRRISMRATGNPYRGARWADWPDNAFRFAALARVAAQIAQDWSTGYRPDVVHAHDWQAGLAPAYLHYAGASVRRP